MAEYEFRFDRADTDAIGLLDASNKQVWTGKDNVNNAGKAGHQKAVSGVTWLQTHFPLQSYAIPTHSERAGAFNPTGNNGYNIEHFRDFNNAGPTVAFGIEAPGHFARGTVGGLWDGLLGEVRNSFIFISSDWHQRGVFGARDVSTTSDFIPGEYTKLY